MPLLGVGFKQNISTRRIKQSLYGDLYIYDTVGGEGQVLGEAAEERGVVGVWLSLSGQQEQQL